VIRASGRSRAREAGFEAGDHPALYAAPEQTLDAFHEALIFGAHQRYRLTGAPCTSGTSDAVHVVLRHVR
jgi:hypothetical protein